MRLIDADELERVFIGKHYGANSIKYFINMQPTIDAMPVKHGRWKNVNKEAIIPTGECSECGQWERVNNYCPNCGTKMDL